MAGMSSLLSAWGFTVDDALISSRVAHHLANNIGYRFNPTGAVVDCVTPLGWAWLLAPFAQISTLDGYWAARVICALSWLAASSVLGVLISQLVSGRLLLALLVCVGTCLPLGTWAASGMETGVAILLCTLALLPTKWAGLAGGLAAALRPELTPWAAAIAIGGTWSRKPNSRAYVQALTLALGPILIVSLLRILWFGRPAPLAVFAKPSDTLHGLKYTWGALILSGPVFLLVARYWGNHLPKSARAIAAATAVHSIVLIGIGGDWMPLWRLAVPIYPAIFLAGAHVAAQGSSVATLARLTPTVLLSLLWHWHQGPAIRGVLSDRLALITEAREVLPHNLAIATLDVGWVGALGSHSVVDLAGVTDERVAFLPGGHTSKQLPKSFLRQRTPRALIVLMSNPKHWPHLKGATLSSLAGRAPFSRAVENRLIQMTDADQYVAEYRLPLGNQAYALYLRHGGL